jgi:hypothetical protein
MALIKCIECGREISDKAAACPQCGCPKAVAGPAPGPQDIRPSIESDLSNDKAAPFLLIGALLGIIVAVAIMWHADSILRENAKIWFSTIAFGALVGGWLGHKLYHGGNQRKRNRNGGVTPKSRS